MIFFLSNDAIGWNGGVAKLKLGLSSQGANHTQKGTGTHLYAIIIIAVKKKSYNGRTTIDVAHEFFNDLHACDFVGAKSNLIHWLHPYMQEWKGFALLFFLFT